jgi:hypothetical protein
VNENAGRFRSEEEKFTEGDGGEEADRKITPPLLAVSDDMGLNGLNGMLRAASSSSLTETFPVPTIGTPVILPV